MGKYVPTYGKPHTPNRNPEMAPPFTFPLITAPGKLPAPDCGCTWAHAPEVSMNRDRPWVLKYVWRGMCRMKHDIASH